MIPFNLNGEKPLAISVDSPFPISRSTVFTRATDLSTANLKAALEQGRPVDIDIQVAMTDEIFDSFESMLSKATELPKVPPIILCASILLFNTDQPTLAQLIGYLLLTICSCQSSN